jgi:hypothetical protein
MDKMVHRAFPVWMERTAKTALTEQTELMVQTELMDKMGQTA